MDDEYLTKCVVDPAKRTFFLYSSEGDTKEVTCDNVEEFMGVLSFVRATCPEERLTYATPITQGKNELYFQKGGKKTPPFFFARKVWQEK